VLNDGLLIPVSSEWRIVVVLLSGEIGDVVSPGPADVAADVATANAFVASLLLILVRKQIFFNVS
jgi:hypothetical protein